MTLSLTALLQARATVPFDIDSDGRVLAGDDQTGSMQLYEIAPSGEWTQLTDLGESCRGRYLPGERAVVVEHDLGGNERGQLSLLRIGGELEPLVHDERYIHDLLDVLPGRVVYSTNRRNGVDFDIVVRSIDTADDRVLYDSGGWMHGIAVSPDERWIVLGRLSMVPNSTQLLMVETATGRIEAITADDEPARSSNPAWRPDSGSFVFNTNLGREFTGVAEYDLATKQIRYLEQAADHDVTGWPARNGSRMLLVDRVDGAETLRIREGESTVPVAMPEHALAAWRLAPVWSPDGKQLALSINSATGPDDIYVWSGAGLARLTESADALPAESLGTPEIHRIPTPDGESIPCFLYRPRNGTGSVVLIIHGGPESEAVQSWNPVLQALLQEGHAVAVPNVRGSTGYGKRWAALDDVRKRLDSVADLAAIHAWLPSVGLDQQRAALYGGSYGGYMVLAGLSMQPELWAAGVDVVGISSLVTFLENTSAYRRAYREREYGSIEKDRDFLVEASPITHVDAIRAPLLIIHGANDPRVPLSEAEQIAAALRARNIECEMLVYHDEGHGLSKRHNKLDAYPRVLDFLNRHLTSSS